MKISLTKPISYRDTLLDSIDFDLDSLTARDLIAVEDQMRANNQAFTLFGQAHIAALAARAAHLPADVIRSLSLKDFMNVFTEIANFLADTASETSTPEHSEE